MLKLKTISIIAIAAMMTSMVGCGNKTDNSSEPVSSSTVAETTADTTAAETTESETEETATTEAAATDTATDATTDATTATETEAVTETETSSETTVEDSTDSEQTDAAAISIDEIDSLLAESLMDKDIDTVKPVLMEKFQIDESTEETFSPDPDGMFTIYTWKMPTEISIGDVNFANISASMTNGNLNSLMFITDYETYDEGVLDENISAIKKAFTDAGYEYNEEARRYNLPNCYADISQFDTSNDITLGFNKAE